MKQLGRHIVFLLALLSGSLFLAGDYELLAGALGIIIISYIVALFFWLITKLFTNLLLWSSFVVFVVCYLLALNILSVFDGGGALTVYIFRKVINNELEPHIHFFIYVHIVLLLAIVIALVENSNSRK